MEPRNPLNGKADAVVRAEGNNYPVDMARPGSLPRGRRA